MSNEIVASCQCGNVEFRASEKPLLELCCHCIDCRKITGNDYTAIAFFNSASVTVFGKVSRQYFTAESVSKTSREFCPECNSIMFDKSDGFPGLIGVLAEQLLLPFDSKPSHHVWVRSKLPHVAIPSQATQYEKNLS